jgi:hypothetical protein
MSAAGHNSGISVGSVVEDVRLVEAATLSLQVAKITSLGTASTFGGRPTGPGWWAYGAVADQGADGRSLGAHGLTDYSDSPAASRASALSVGKLRCG